MCTEEYSIHYISDSNKFQESNSKSTTSLSRVDLKARTAFSEINKRAKNQPELVKKIGAVIVFDITKDGTVQQSWSK